MADRHQRSSHPSGGGRRDRPRGDDRSHRRDDDRDNSRRNRSRSPKDRHERPDRRKRDYDDDRKPRDDPDKTRRDRPSHRDDGRDRERPRPKDDRRDRDREDSRKDRDLGKDRGKDKPRERDANGFSRNADRPTKPPSDQPPSRNRTASPKRRSASPQREPSDDMDLELPSRHRKEKSSTPAAHPVHIKLGKHDGETSSLRNETPADQPTENDRDAATPMDEDEPEDDIIIEDDGLDAMQAMMGFGSFGTTKGKKIAGNNVGAVRKEKKTEYRQYMNRVGGFNRPLDQI